jgi:hypothetical protein
MAFSIPLVPATMSLWSLQTRGSGLAEMDGTALRFARERMRWEIVFPEFYEPWAA